MKAVASQPPVVSEAAAGATPVAGGASITALPSVMQELAKSFWACQAPLPLEQVETLQV